MNVFKTGVDIGSAWTRRAGIPDPSKLNIISKKHTLLHSSNNNMWETLGVWTGMGMYVGESDLLDVEHVWPEISEYIKDYQDDEKIILGSWFGLGMWLGYEYANLFVRSRNKSETNIMMLLKKHWTGSYDDLVLLVPYIVKGKDILLIKQL